jgi:hypothetical protein
MWIHHLNGDQSLPIDLPFVIVRPSIAPSAIAQWKGDKHYGPDPEQGNVRSFGCSQIRQLDLV